VQPFWLSDEEKWPSLELCMGGVHGRSWSSIAGHGGVHRRGERRGAGGGEGASWVVGHHGEGLLWMSSVGAPLSVQLPLAVHEKKAGGRKEKGVEKEKEGKQKKKIWKIFQT
jgi:hypothetical protein